MGICQNISMYCLQIWNIFGAIYNINIIKSKITNDEPVSENNINNLKNNINNIGIFAIKLIQWSNARMRLISDKPNLHNFLNHLDTYYEECPIHNIKYTEQIFLNDFQENIYTNLEIDNNTISSGSIGQVYKGKLIKENKSVAIKCVHPNIYNQITLPKYLFIFFNDYLTCLPYIKNYKVPLDIRGFFDSLEKQMNLKYEVDNMLKMRKNYKNNPYIIIPEPYLHSKNIIIMSYEEGCSFNKLSISDYKKFKIMTLFKIFIRSSIFSEGLLHGDLHNGNWKISNTKLNNLYPIIIYDLGLCYNLPENYINQIQLGIDKKNLPLLVNLLLDPIAIHYSPYKNDKDLDNIKILINKEVKEAIEKKFSHLQNITFNDLKLLFPIFINRGFIFSSIFLNIMIVIILTADKFKNNTETALNYDDMNISKNNRYTVQYPSMISFCKTYNIFPEYQSMMVNLLNEFRNNNKIEMFHGIEDKIEFIQTNL
jgi:predicted unusual protein kinase regulating ubiquinone biosynthesis (AarF/ABC1/UbiB family)